MLGSRLKKLRESAGLQQKDLAKKLNVSPSSIGMYERNEREPNNDLLLQLADFFNVSVDYLLGKTNIQNIKFANSGGLDTTGLDKDEIEELKKQVEFMKWKKSNGTK